VDRALALAGRTGERLFEAELHRLRGEFLLAEDVAAGADAEACFRRAAATARRQGAAALELRAATSLARLGRAADARPLLADVYGRFTEGFDTPDLADARAVLDAP